MSDKGKTCTCYNTISARRVFGALINDDDDDNAMHEHEQEAVDFFSLGIP